MEHFAGLVLERHPERPPEAAIIRGPSPAAEADKSIRGDRSLRVLGAIAALNFQNFFGVGQLSLPRRSRVPLDLFERAMAGDSHDLVGEALRVAVRYWPLASFRGDAIIRSLSEPSGH